MYQAPGSYVCHTNPQQAVLPREWWQNPLVVYRAFTAAETSEDRVHGAELQNWRGALQAGGEEAQKKKKEKKNPSKLYITKRLTVFLPRIPMTFVSDTPFCIPSPNIYIHVL